MVEAEGASGIYENKDFTSLEDAIRETSSRVKYLATLSDGDIQSVEVAQQAHDIVARMLASCTDWKQWQYEIGNILNDAKYPANAAELLGQCFQAIPPNEEGDDVHTKLARDLVLSLTEFAAINSQFSKAVAQSGCLKEVLGFLSKQQSVNVPLLKSCLRLPLILGYYFQQVWQAVEATCINDKPEQRGVNVLPMCTSDNECQCVAFLWLSRLIAKNKSSAASFDHKDIFAVMAKFLKSSLENDNKMMTYWLINSISTFTKFLDTMPDACQSEVKATLLHILGNSQCYSSGALMKAQQLLSTLSPSESEVQFLKCGDFKTNNELTTAEEIRNENVSRIALLRKMYETSSESIVCLDVANTVALLQQSRLFYREETEEWKTAYENVLVQENFAEVALKYAKVLVQRDLDKEDLSNEILQVIYRMLWNLCNSSRAMRICCAENGVVDFFLDILMDVDGATTRSASSENYYYALVSAPLSILYNISRTATQVKPVFLKRDAAKILLPYLDDAKYRKVIQASLCIAYVVSDTPESSKLADEKGILKMITDMAKEAMDSKDRLARTSVGTMWSLSELLDGLVLLAKNDDNKLKLLKCGVDCLVEKLLTQGKGRKEVVRGIDLLWTICFDSTIRNEILTKHKDDIIQLLETLTVSDDEDIRTAAKEAFSFIGKWAAMTEETARNEAAAAMNEVVPSPKKSAATGGHVFLSYSWKQQETVLKIRNELLNRNFKVWMDVDKMHGGLLDAMAKAVEDAAVVLLCFSQSYKQSNPCRAEAQYAYSLGKTIVPVNMEYRYQADGWLGIMVRPLLYVDMSLAQKPFEDSVDSLLSEIHNAVVSELPTPTADVSLVPNNSKDSAAEVEQPRTHGSIVLSPPSKSTAAKPPLTAKGGSPKPQYASWNCAEFAKWLQKEQLHLIFGAKLKRFDGEKIWTLLRIKDQAPVFFYQSLKEHVGATLPDFLDLIAALERLASENSS